MSSEKHALPSGTATPDSEAPILQETELGTTPGAAAPDRVADMEKDASALAVADSDKTTPTEEELATLRKVAGSIPWIIIPIAFVEMCERISYCGTVVVFVNFVQQKLPPGSSTGAGFSGQSGALGLGQRASTGITTFDTFWTYATPMLGGYLADVHWGKYKTIQLSCVASLLGHALLIIAAAPPLLADKVPGDGKAASLACLILGIIVSGLGSGAFKANISPLIAEQFTNPAPWIKTLKSGERVIVDHDLTITRVYMYLYLLLNIGAIIGETAMVYAEKYVGFWLSFTLPTTMYLLCPLIMYLARPHFYESPPPSPGSNILTLSLRIIRRAFHNKFSFSPRKLHQNLTSATFWDAALPSKTPESERPAWMTFSDDFVHELSRGLKACKVFLWFPLYWLSYNQMNNNLCSQAATLNTHSLPNDFYSNANPVALIIIIPLLEHGLYPFLRRINHPLLPLRRITLGFFAGAVALLAAAVLQHFIYLRSPCGAYANECDRPSDISAWTQISIFALIGLSEVLAITTGMEYAFTQAPESMRGLVMAVFWFMAAVGAVVQQVFTPVSEDPWLVVNYAVPAGVLLVMALGFMWSVRGKE